MHVLENRKPKSSFITALVFSIPVLFFSNLSLAEETELVSGMKGMKIYSLEIEKAVEVLSVRKEYFFFGDKIVEVKDDLGQKHLISFNESKIFALEGCAPAIGVCVGDASIIHITGGYGLNPARIDSVTGISLNNRSVLGSSGAQIVSGSPIPFIEEDCSLGGFCIGEEGFFARDAKSMGHLVGIVPRSFYPCEDDSRNPCQALIFEKDGEPYFIEDDHRVVKINEFDSYCEMEHTTPLLERTIPGLVDLFLLQTNSTAPLSLEQARSQGTSSFFETARRIRAYEAVIKDLMGEEVSNRSDNIGTISHDEFYDDIRTLCSLGADLVETH